MGRLSGFRYREVVRILKGLGFVFHRQAAGSHEIWFNPSTNRFTPFQIIPEKYQPELYKQY